MNNLQRAEMELEGVNLTQQQLIIYLAENDLKPFEPYVAESLVSQKAILQVAQNALESIANNPENFASYKLDDQSVSEFSEAIHRRLNYLTRKIRNMKDVKNTDIFMFYM